MNDNLVFDIFKDWLQPMYANEEEAIAPPREDDIENQTARNDQQNLAPDTVDNRAQSSTNNAVVIASDNRTINHCDCQSKTRTMPRGMYTFLMIMIPIMGISFFLAYMESTPGNDMVMEKIALQQLQFNSTLETIHEELVHQSGLAIEAKDDVEQLHNITREIEEEVATLAMENSFEELQEMMEKMSQDIEAIQGTLKLHSNLIADLFSSQGDLLATTG